MCPNGLGWCVFEVIFGAGAAVIALLFIASLVGIQFGKDD